MKIPEFKLSKRFLRDVNLPCLISAVKNSDFPGVATQAIAEFKKDPKCKIYLRGVDSKISTWQQEKLEQLLENNGLPAVVAEAMNEYNTSPEWAGDFCSELDETERQKFKEHGVAAFIEISIIVIDEIEQKVLIRANTSYDGNLDEHGITFHSSEGRWRFDYAEFFDRYESRLREAQELKRQQKWRKKWEAVFPPPEPDAQIQTDGSTLYGVWRPDKHEKAKALKLFGAPPHEIEAALAPSKLDLTTGMYFSSTKMEDMVNGYTSNEYEILGYERKGTRLTIQVMKTFDNGDRVKITYEFWYDGNRLVQTSENDAFVYLRGEDSYRKGDISPLQKLMNERRDQKKERAALKKDLTDNKG